MKRCLKYLFFGVIGHLIVVPGGWYSVDIRYYKDVEFAGKDAERNIFVTVLPNQVEYGVPLLYRREASTGLYRVGCHANFSDNTYKQVKAVSASVTDEGNQEVQLALSGKREQTYRWMQSGQEYYSFAIDLTGNQPVAGNVEVRVELELVAHDGTIVTKQLRRRFAPKRIERFVPYWYHWYRVGS